MGQSSLPVRRRSLCIGVPAASPLLATAAITGFVAFLYAPVIEALVQQWWTDPNYGYCFFVPPISAWILWRERRRWSIVSRHPSFHGLWIMLLAMGLLIAGTLGAERFTAGISLLVLLSGMIVFLAGKAMLRLVAFPLGYLVFMVPLPALVFYQLTLPLQLVASQFGAFGLNALGVHTLREGNLLVLSNCTLDVLEACSGVRSLLSLLAALTAFAYLANRTLRKCCALILLAIPAVIVSNGLRLVATGLLSRVAGPQADSGLIHLALGMSFFLLAFFMILSADRGLRYCTLRESPRLPN